MVFQSVNGKCQLKIEEAKMKTKNVSACFLIILLLGILFDNCVGAATDSAKKVKYEPSFESLSH